MNYLFHSKITKNLCNKNLYLKIHSSSNPFNIFLIISSLLVDEVVEEVGAKFSKHLIDSFIFKTAILVLCKNSGKLILPVFKSNLHINKFGTCNCLNILPRFKL